MSEGKSCPFTMANLDSEEREAGHDMCLDEMCQWFLDGDCAIMTLAKAVQYVTGIRAVPPISDEFAEEIGKEQP